MEFKDVEAREGVVIATNDPEKLGRIKVVVPGEFDNSTMDTDLMPWIYPLNMTRYCSFSKMVSGGKVWLIKNNNNHNEYYYIPFFEKIGIVSEFLDEHYDENPEVVFARDNCGTPAMITYDGTQGIILKVKEYYIQITPDGDIICHSSNVDMSIKNNQVMLGKPGSKFEHMVMGATLLGKLNSLENALSKLTTKASKNVFTQHLQHELEACQKAITTTEEELLSKSCQVSLE